MLRREAGERPSRLVRVYAFGYAVTVTGLSAFGMLGSIAILRSAAVAFGDAVMLVMTIALLGLALVAQRRRQRVRYRLICSPDL